MIRVLAVDDSAVARNAYRLILSPDEGFDLIATAPNADIARRKIAQLDPDVVVLDIEMPGEDGLSLLKWLMANFPLPVVVSSSYSFRGAEQTMLALSLGAVEVVCKGGPLQQEGWSDDFASILRTAVQAASRARRRARFPAPPALVERRPAPVAAVRRASAATGCVVIGASTGGTEALAELIAAMPADFPPTFIVQHMPPIYTRSFAERLDRLGAVRVSEAQDRQTIGPGEVLVAPGGLQMRVARGAGGPQARISREPPHNRHAPSVDVLFDSAANVFAADVRGVLLTGMGNDGAEGLLHIRQRGGLTIAQSEETCVVYGMPAEAVKRNAAVQVLDLDRIVAALLGS